MLRIQTLQLDCAVLKDVKFAKIKGIIDFSSPEDKQFGSIDSGSTRTRSEVFKHVESPSRSELGSLSKYLQQEGR